MCKTVCLLEFDTLFYGFMRHICVYVMDLALDFCISLTSYASILVLDKYLVLKSLIFALYIVGFAKCYSNIARYITL